MAAPVAAAAARTAARPAAKAGAGKAAARRPRAPKPAAAATRPPVELVPEPVETSTPATAPDRSELNSRGGAPDALTNMKGAPAWYRTDTVKAANAGGGFALGMLAYVLGLTYLRGGKPAVKAWLSAKFLNKVQP